MAYSIDQLIEYKLQPGLQHKWHPGWIVDLPPHEVVVRPCGGGDDITLPRRRIQALTGRRLADFRGAMVDRQLAAVLGIRAGLAAKQPPHVIARTDGKPAAVRAPSPRWRCRAYRQAVARNPCCNPCCPTPREPIEAHHSGPHGVGQKASDATCVPLCRACHRAVTRTYRVPGLSRSQTTDLFARVAQELINAWLVEQDEQLEVVPVLQRVAAARAPLRLVAAAVLLLSLLATGCEATPGQALFAGIGLSAAGLGLVFAIFELWRRPPPPSLILWAGLALAAAGCPRRQPAGPPPATDPDGQPTPPAIRKTPLSHPAPWPRPACWYKGPPLSLRGVEAGVVGHRPGDFGPDVLLHLPLGGQQLQDHADQLHLLQEVRIEGQAEAELDPQQVGGALAGAVVVAPWGGLQEREQAPRQGVRRPRLGGITFFARNGHCSIVAWRPMRVLQGSRR